MKLLTWMVVMLFAATVMAEAQEATTYRVLATSKTSTMQKEMQDAALGDQGFEALGMTVGQTALGGAELVVITRRKAR